MKVQARMIRAVVSLISTKNTMATTTNRIVPITVKTTNGIKSAGLFFTAPTISKMETIRVTTKETVDAVTTDFAPKKNPLDIVIKVSKKKVTFVAQILRLLLNEGVIIE